jgi:hypothetical protein
VGEAAVGDTVVVERRLLALFRHPRLLHARCGGDAGAASHLPGG